MDNFKLYLVIINWTVKKLKQLKLEFLETILFIDCLQNRTSNNRLVVMPVNRGPIKSYLPGSQSTRGTRRTSKTPPRSLGNPRPDNRVIARNQKATGRLLGNSWLPGREARFRRNEMKQIFWLRAVTAICNRIDLRFGPPRNATVVSCSERIKSVNNRRFAVRSN